MRRINRHLSNDSSRCLQGANPLFALLLACAFMGCSDDQGGATDHSSAGNGAAGSGGAAGNSAAGNGGAAGNSAAGNGGAAGNSAAGSGGAAGNGAAGSGGYGAIGGALGDTPLSSLAASMAPGTWAELKTEGLTAEITDAPEPGSGLKIAGWSDDAHWDSRTHQFLFMGLRQTRRLIAYSERTNSWRSIPFAGEAGAPHLENRFGHIYGNNALDIERSRFYHLYHAGATLPGSLPSSNEAGVSFYDLVAESWVTLPPGGVYPMTGSIEYFSRRGGLVHDHGSFFNDATSSWESIVRPPVQGHHSLARHNPFREEVLFIGGNETGRVVAAMGPDGALSRWPDLAEDVGVRFDKLTVDPTSGHYLLMRSSAEQNHELWELNGDTQDYRLVDDFTTTPWPFHRYDQPVVSFIPEYGVTLWLGDHSKTVWLYRHAP